MQDRAPITALERDWKRELTGTTLGARFQRWCDREPVLGACGNPQALIRYLRASPAGERQDELLLALLRCARDDPLAAKLLLMRLLPGVKRRVAHLLRDPSEREELWSALLLRLWERIRTYPPSGYSGVWRRT